MYSQKRILDLKIISKTWLNDEFFLLELKAEDKLPITFPGQFVEILIENSKTTFLRRPISIHEIDYRSNTISFLIQVAGDGTKALSLLDINDTINTILPLGNSFSLPDTDGEFLLVGGGCGIAPLLFLARELNNKGFKPNVLIGGKSKDYVLRPDEYLKYGKVHITTEDGSLGEKGFVIHHSVLWDENRKFDKIYTCGPEPMMKAIAKYARKRDISCEVSLENLMACGIGACLCCVVDTLEGNKCTCTEGPVFNSDQLKWQI